MMRQLLSFCVLLFAVNLASAQELQCVVDIQAPNQGSDKQVYDQMKEAITKYVNFRKWTDLKYAPEERIKCRMQFIFNGRPSIDQFTGTVQVQLIRPVYDASYESMVLNVMDQNVNISFTAFQPLEFSENNYIDELTSILNFYCYMLVGLDQATFKLNSGNEWFQKAQNIVNLAASNGGTGWRNFDGTQNRYWLVNDLLDNSLAKVHNVYYVYHRQGLDKMAQNIQLARRTILQSLREMQKVNQRYPGKFITRVFVTAKSPEIIDLFKKAEMQDRRALVGVMEKLDPANSSDYAELMKSR